MGDRKDLERILMGHMEPRDLALQLLLEITENFSEKRNVGVGGFGVVYKGELQNGIVAVKRIIVSECNVDDVTFRREVENLMKMRDHRNVVRFLGFCSTGQDKFIKETGSTKNIWAEQRERLLCFNYISNGSLNKHITDELRGLDWSTRYDIINGICHGLDYLHEEKNIIHMDLKPSNIMLDNDMIPKITDFGLSRPDKNTHTSGTRFSTKGYCAPEYEKDGETTKKADIYSLGVIIVELVTGRRGLPSNNHDVLRRWRHRWIKASTLLNYQEHQLTRCMEIARRCRKADPKDRPSIGHILDVLREIERDKVHIGQESTYLDDDMLDIEPLELKLNEEMSWSVKLTNNTKACFAFHIERPSKQYTIQPDKGIVPPKCGKCLVQITVRAAQVTHNVEKFIVRSTKVNEGLRVENITKDIFYEVAGKVVDEVDLMVASEPVEPVSPKAIDSSSYDDGARRQRDRRNFHPPENFSRSQPTNKTYLSRVSDRAVDVTRGAMGSLLHKLGELRKEEFNLETSVKEDIDSLSKELVKMQPVLRKASEVQQDNLDNLVKFWVSNVREMSYDLEDFVDGFLEHNEPESNTSGFRELTHELCFLLDNGKSHHVIRDLIKDKCKQVQNEAKNHKEFKVDNFVVDAAATITDTIDPRKLVVFQRPKELVGIEEPRDNIIKRLSHVPEKQLRIFSIYGAGGLGKTTLAKAVYDKLEGQFHHMAFIFVGRNPDKKQVLREILDDLTNDSNIATLNEVQIIKELHRLLKNKRYFIVIDDIWDSKEWGFIESAFPENSLGSRVTITTRIEGVARACCNFDMKYVYEIKPLCDEDSRTLFSRRIFGSKEACPDALKEVTNDIMKKCGGMPLAINSIASLLAGDESRSTWEYVWKSLGVVTEGDDVENMKKILDLSYIHLPDHLKTCLLHVCMYPEDRKIDKNDLTRQWVAEGFVVSTNGRLDADDVAEKYFKELINMCMIQPGRIDNYSNEVLSCKVHDIILDLMRSKSSEENFMHVIDGSKDKTRAHGEIRRISVHYNDKEDSAIIETIKGSILHARSALFFQVSPVPYLLVFKYVRVLHIEYSGNYTDLDLTSISRLFLLRYLKIERSYVNLKLPDKIGELQQLETIDIGEASLKNYPSDIVSLPWLSHLRYGRTGIALPEGVERLKSLHTLEGVHISGSSVQDIRGLGNLTNLRKLQISLELFHLSKDATTAIRLDALHSSISMLSASLRILTFGEKTIRDVPPGWISRTLFPKGSNIRELNLGCCRFERCPEWISQLRNLYKFTIMVSEVADGVNIVAWLPSLAYFKLVICVIGKEEKEESVAIPSTGSGAFQALKHMVFDCPKASLVFEAGAMPKLEKLDIKFRYDMTPQFLPVGIQHLPAPTLEKICLTVEPGALEVEGSEDWGSEVLEEYVCSYEYIDKLTKHESKLRRMLKRAFKRHHPGADLNIIFEGLEEYYYLDDDSEDDEGVGDEEDYYCGEEDGEAAYQVNGSQTSAQVQPSTSQLVQQSEVQQDSDRMSISTDVALVVDTSLHLGVGPERWPCRHGEGFAVLESLQLPFTHPLAHSSPSSLHLTLALTAPLHGSPPPPPCSSPDRAETMANFPADVNNDLLVQHGYNWMLVNAVARNVNHDFPPGGLPDLNQDPNEMKNFWTADLTLALASPLHCVNAVAQNLNQDFPPGGLPDLNQATNEFNGGDYYYTEDDEAAYQMNASQASAQVQAITRHLVHLIEAPPYSSADGAKPMANFPAHINNELSVQQGNSGMLVNAVAQSLNQNLPPGGLIDLNQAPTEFNGGDYHSIEDDEAAYQVNGSQTRQVQLSEAPPCSSPDRAEPMTNFPGDINNDLLVQQGNNGMPVNAVGQNLNHNFPPGGLLDLNQVPCEELNDE